MQLGLFYIKTTILIQTAIYLSEFLFIFRPILQFCFSYKNRFFNIFPTIFTYI